VRNSYAKCTLSGADYIGGVVGWGERVTNCAAIATIAEGTEYLGAIAGDADLTDGALSGNVFVDTGTAGIDSISYAGIAEPVAFEALRQRAGVPVDFVSFTLTLTAEEQQVAAIPFQYGEDLTLIDLPAVPEKEGYYGVWPEFDTSGLNSDMTVEAVYTAWVTLVASTAQDGKLALALAEGQFTQDVILNVEESAATPPQANAPEQQADVWEVSLEGVDLADTDEIPLRLLNRSGGKAVVYQLVNGQWQTVAAAVNGHYLLVTMNGASGTFCVRGEQSSALWFIVLAAAAIVVLLLALLVRHRRAKRRVSAPAASVK
jgi:hypothetical protein